MEHSKAKIEKVFISYAREDIDTAERIYKDLESEGLSPWIDLINIRPGMAWESEIKKAIRESDRFLFLMSNISVSKGGYVLKELEEAIKIHDQFHDGKIFIISIRLEKCDPKHPRLKKIHWVDLFRSYDRGMDRLLVALEIKEPIDERPEGKPLTEIQTNKFVNEEPPILNIGEYLKNISYKKRRQFGEKLRFLAQQSATEFQMVINLYSENHLCISSWDDLIDPVIQCDKDSKKINQAIRTFCRSHILKGAPIRVPQQSSLVIMRSLDGFCNLILKQSDLFDSFYEVQEWVEDALLYSELDNLPEFCKQIRLSQFYMWCNFDINGTQHFKTKDVQHILSSLGLNFFGNEGPLILFEYFLPTGITAHYPTFCDVYSSETWSLNFRPVPLCFPYGLTIPKSGNSPPLPEAVHRPITMENLTSMRLMDV